MLLGLGTQTWTLVRRKMLGAYFITNITAGHIHRLFNP